MVDLKFPAEMHFRVHCYRNPYIGACEPPRPLRRRVPQPGQAPVWSTK